jgi:hypothetical protein
MNELWSGGADAYHEALRERCLAERDKLRAQLKAAKNESERCELEKQIASLTETYREKARTIRWGLF